MNKQLFGRGIFNRTSEVFEQGNLNKVSNMTTERLAGGGFTFSGLKCMHMSLQYFTRRVSGGVADITGRSTFAGVVLLAFAVFILSGIFSTHTEAQAADPVINLTKVSGGDDTTERVYTAATTFTGSLNFFLVFTDVLKENCVDDLGRLDLDGPNKNNYTAGTNHTVAADTHSCFVAQDTATSTRIFASTDVVSDTTNPSIVGTPTLRSNNSTTTVAKAGETITLSFVVSEALASDPSATIAGETATVVKTVGSDTEYTATYQVTSSTTNGQAAYDIGTLTDLASNTFDPIAVTLTGSAGVFVDRTSPVITFGSFNFAAGFLNAGYPVTVTDASEPITTQYLDNATSCDASTTGSFQTFTGTSHTFPLGTQTCFKATDAAGNVAYAITPELPTMALIAAHDTGSSSTDSITNRPANSTFTFQVTGSFTVGETFTLYDTGGSTLATKTIATGEESSFQLIVSNFGSSLNFNGESVLRLQNSDIATAYRFVIDRIAPDVTVAAGGTAGTFIVSATDTNGSGVATYGVADSVSESNCTASNIGNTSFNSYTSGGDHPVSSGTASCFRVFDTAGNVAYASTGDPAPPPDTTAPSISSATLTSNNTNTKVATIGDVLTLAFVTDEALVGTPIVNIANVTAVVSGSGTTFSARLIVNSSAQEGAVTYDIGELTDAAGNTRNPSPVTTAGSTLVTVDTTDPTLTVVDATNTAITSDRTFTITASDTNTVTVAYLNDVDSCTAQTSGNYTSLTLVSGTATRVVEANEQDCFRATDVAGNTTYRSTPVVPGQPPVVDNTAPSISSATLTSNNTNTKVATVGDVLTLAFVTDEALTTMPTVNIADTAATVSGSGTTFSALLIVASTTQEGAVTYDIGTLTDAAGNTRNPSLVTTAGSTLVTVDTTDPTLTVVDANSGAISTDRTFTITASDTNTVTVGYLDNVDSCTAQTSGIYTSLTLTSGTTTRVVEANEQDCFKATDVAGNTTYTGTPAVSDLIDPPVTPPTNPPVTPPSSTDTTAPTFDLSYAGSPNIVNNIAYYNTATLTTGGVTISNITEENLATATLTLARTDTTGVTDITPASAIHSVTGAVSFANATSVPNGIYTATVTLTDDAGNATTKTLNLVVDNATPTITSVTIPDPSARSSVRATVTVRHNQTIQETLTATLTGQNCSSLNRITLTGSGTASTQIQLRGRTGTFACTITLTDQAGNTSSSFTIPSFTIERSSSGGGGGGGGGVRSGGYVRVPTFQASAPSIVPSQPTVPTPTSTQPTPVPTQPQAPLSPELQERIALLKLALNRILERIQLLLAQQTKG